MIMQGTGHHYLNRAPERARRAWARMVLHRLLLGSIQTSTRQDSDFLKQRWVCVFSHKLRDGIVSSQFSDPLSQCWMLPEVRRDPGQGPGGRGPAPFSSTLLHTLLLLLPNAPACNSTTKLFKASHWTQVSRGPGLRGRGLSGASSSGEGGV